MDPGYEPVKIASVNRCISMAETLSRFSDVVKAYFTQRCLLEPVQSRTHSVAAVPMTTANCRFRYEPTVVAGASVGAGAPVVGVDDDPSPELFASTTIRMTMATIARITPMTVPNVYSMGGPLWE